MKSAIRNPVISQLPKRDKRFIAEKPIARLGTRRQMLFEFVDTHVELPQSISG